MRLLPLLAFTILADIDLPHIWSISINSPWNWFNLHYTIKKMKIKTKKRFLMNISCEHSATDHLQYQYHACFAKNFHRMYDGVQYIFWSTYQVKSKKKIEIEMIRRRVWITNVFFFSIRKLIISTSPIGCSSIMINVATLCFELT